jgi:phosphate transport system permease protein
MNDMTEDDNIQMPVRMDWNSPKMQKRLRRRYRVERIFRTAGLMAVLSAGMFLFLILGKIIYDGTPGFIQTSITLDITFDADIVGDPKALKASEFNARVQQASMLQILNRSLMTHFPDINSRSDQRRLRQLFSTDVREKLRNMLLKNPSIVGQTIAVDLLASDDIDQLAKGHIDVSQPEANRRIKDKELAWYRTFERQGRTSLSFNTGFLTGGDSSEPELAGIWGATIGSALTLLVTITLAFPTGLLAAVYLEEFAPKNKLTTFIEMNINNLAAVPSIVFGLLGLAVFLGVMHLPRSAPIVGGLTLALMTLPTIIIASRAAIQAVPKGIRDAAIALGASPMQVVFHHVMPLAMPGVLTGTIIGMAQALGETAPLLMIGMVAFIVDVPTGIMDAATALPVQIFLWADSPERAFIEKTSAAIMVLLAFLIAMNGLAIWLRQKFEKKW